MESRVKNFILKEALDKRLFNVASEADTVYQELWERAPVAYHTLDTNGVITRVNLTEAEMLGYSVAEMVGQPIFNFILKEQRQQAEERFRMKIIGQSLNRREDRIYIRKDGRQVCVIINDVLEKDRTGRVVGIWTTMVDVTSQKKLEQRLIESYKHLGNVNRRISVLLDLVQSGRQDKKKILKYILQSALNISNAVQVIYYRRISGYHYALESAIKLNIQEKKSLQVINIKKLIRLAYSNQRNYRVNGFLQHQIQPIFNNKARYKYYLTLPFFKKNTLRGMLFLGFSQKPNLSHQEYDFYDLFSFHASVALNNAGFFS
jgi:PAS domain S-box-containing protein